MRDATEAYNAERDRIAMTGDLEPSPTCPVDRLPEADADAFSPLWALVECVKWLEERGRKERTTARMLAQRLAALENEVDAFMDDVGYIVGERPTHDWDDETDWKEGRW